MERSASFSCKLFIKCNTVCSNIAEASKLQDSLDEVFGESTIYELEGVTRKQVHTRSFIPSSSLHATTTTEEKRSYP